MKCIYALAAVFAAVATHRCADFLVSLGLTHGLDRDYAHVAVGPLAVAAVAMFAGLLWFAVADRDGWFADLVRTLEATSFRRSFAIVVALAAATLFGMESVEQWLSLGHLSGAFVWLGASVPVAAVVIGIVAAAIVTALRYGARALVDALDAVRATGEFGIAQRARAVLASTFEPLSRFTAPSHALVVVRVRGLRAPPHFA